MCSSDLGVELAAAEPLPERRTPFAGIALRDRRTDVLHGEGAVEVAEDGERDAQGLPRQLARVRRPVEREVEQLAASAEQQWPRGDEKNAPRARNKQQPYHSQDRFITGMRYVTGGIEGYIDNDAVNKRGQRYWFYIKMANNISPIQAYVKKPLRVIAEKIAKELANDIHKLMQGA